jgi:6-phosphogluconolactonase
MTNIYKPRLIEFETFDTLIKKSVEFIEDKVIEYESENGIVRLLLAGGNSPLPVYQKLGKSPIIKWESVELFQSDERFTPATNDKSNQYNIIKSLTPETINLCREANFIDTSTTIDNAISDYEERLDSLDGIWFDLVVLGIGSDGHIASLFTNEDIKSKKQVLHTKSNNAELVNDRVSLSVESILNSREIIVLLTGESKTGIVGEIVEGNLPASQFPAKILYTHPRVSMFFCLQ